MAKYIKEVEASIFVVSDAEKAAVDAGDIVISPAGIQIKHDGNEYFGLVTILSRDMVRVNENDYILQENGKALQVIAKSSFEDNYKPVDTPAPSSEVPAPSAN